MMYILATSVEQTAFGTCLHDLNTSNFFNLK